MGAENWLLRITKVVSGDVLEQASKLRDELYEYLSQVNHGSAYMFNNSDFIIKLAQSGHMSEAQRL